VLFYQVGPDQWVSQFLVGKVQPLGEVPGGVDTGLWIGVDLYEQVLTVYEGNNPIFATLISSGLQRWQTREGLFHIYYRAGREDMSWGDVGDDYYLLEEVPWTMFFDEANALHGAYWHDGLGYRRSHGCVNMSITDANWLFNKVAEFMGPGANPAATGPAVYVYSTGVYNR
jgi:lipoprotein-anchoring transpeptidase ErfK/SrfK